MAAWNVTLLEAGGPAPAGTIPLTFSGSYHGSEIDWHYPIEPQPYSCLNLPGYCSYSRGKAVGGSALLNSHLYTRGNRENYEEIKNLGNEGWGWEDVLPYFLKSEDNLDFDKIPEFADSQEYHSKGGYLPVSRSTDQPEVTDFFLRAAEELGFKNGDLNGINQTVFTIAQLTARNGEQMTTSRAFLFKPEVLNRDNLNILTNSHVTKVIFGKNNRAIGVEYRRSGVVKRLYARKEVILCSGALATPQLLLASGVGSSQHLTDKGIAVVANLPGVGQNFMDHVSFSIPIVLKNVNSYNRLNISSLNNFILNRTGALTSTGLNQITGFVHLNESDRTDVPDTLIFFEGYNANCSSTGLQACCDSRNRIIRMFSTFVKPKSRGYVELQSSNPFEYPKIISNYFKIDDDLEMVLKGVRFVQKFIGTGPMKELGAELLFNFLNFSAHSCTSYVIDSDDYWKCAIRHLTYPGNHQMGTCHMGPETDEMAVVSDRLLVKRVKNLRVIDASIFPISITGNINVPIIMAAEKGSDFIKQRWLNVH